VPGHIADYKITPIGEPLPWRDATNTP